MSTDPTNRTSTLERLQNRAAVRDALPAAIALIAAEAVVGALHLHPDVHRWQVVVLLVPVLPAIWLGWAQWRSIRRSDEYQRTAQLEALGVGFATAMLIVLVAEVLDRAKLGSDTQFLQITFIGSVLAWATTLVVRLRR